MNRTFEQTESAGRGSETRDRILDAAERLFTLHGFAATSLRAITAEARVNLAAVNYHFHNKDTLTLEVLKRKMAPLEQKRLVLLDELEAAAGDGPLRIEDVLTALFAPIIEARAQGADPCTFPKLMARALAEPGEWSVPLMRQVMAKTAERFRPAVLRALTGTPRAEISWGLHFSIGAMIHYLRAPGLLGFMSEGSADPGDSVGALRRLVAYSAGGLRALAELEQTRKETEA